MRFAMLVLIMGVMMISCQKSSQPADRVFKNARFWTVNAEQPLVSVIAVKNSRIIYVGNDIPDGLISVSTEVVDLQNHFALPGMIDTHLHFLHGGFSLSQIDLRNCKSKEEFIQKIADYAKKLPKGEWILSGNWDHTLWPGEPLPERSWIDNISPDNPVFINRLDGHMALANSLALKLAGVDKKIATPAGGVIVRTRNGELTGILKDAAMNLISRIQPEPGLEFKLQAAENAVHYLLQNGITSAHDMGTLSDLEIYKQLIEQKKLKVRLTSYIPIPQWEELKTLDLTSVDKNLLKVNGVKGFMDGSLGSGTARFFEPYTNDPNNRGVWDEQAIPLDKMYDRLRAVHDLQKQVAVHAIGDEANATLLEFYGKIKTSSPNRQDNRFRIEHAQHLRVGDIAAFSKYGVIACMQPYHCIDDGRWAEERIGYERCRTTYAFRTLLDSNTVLAFGSDWYVAPVSPMWGIYAAVTRCTLDDQHPDGWIPEQKISIEEAIRCYTINGAYADFSENDKGSLEINKLADFVVLSENITKIDPVKIKDVQVLKTVVGGEVAYEKK